MSEHSLNMMQCCLKISHLQLYCSTEQVIIFITLVEVHQLILNK